MKKVLFGSVVCCAALALATGLGAGEDAGQWTQWGGPAQDFQAPSGKLADSWPEGGPKQLWSRELGAGYSAILVEDGRLYTMYRDGDEEVVIAIDPADGKTVWEHRYSAPIPKSESMSTQYGKGPNATPLLIDGKLVTLGFTGHVRCVDAAKGELTWSHDLGEKFEVATPYFGHATSPLAVGGNVLIVAGGLLAFDLASGELAWQNREFEGSYGSPLLVDAGDKKQIVSPVAAHLAGFDAGTGKTLWSQEHKNQWGTILTSPVVDDSGRVFISTHQVGSLLVDPTAAGDDSQQVWRDGTTQVAHSNAVRAGSWIFASVGDSASFLTATSLEDGTQAWKERGFAQANLVRVGDDFLLLDFEGELALVELNAEGMEVVTRASINDEKTWTPPTLIGTTLYVRDESRMVALDLSAGKGE